MSDEDIAIDEKRVYGDKRGAVTLAVATGMGVARVAVSGEQVGEFGLATREPARDVVTAPPDIGGGVAVATAEDVLVGDLASLTSTGFGPAVAVGRDGDYLVAAAEDGRIAGLGGPGEDWEDLAVLEADVRALDGDLVATSDGVHRVTTAGVQPAGLDDVHDVAAGTIPHAATTSGLYYLGNGWMDVMTDDFRVVELTTPQGRIERGHAATRDACYEHRDGDWVACDVTGEVTDVAHGPRDYAITRDGTVLLRRDAGWHARSLGLPDAVGIAVVGGTVDADP